MRGGVIAGLYAADNVMAYAGVGGTLGSALVFGHIAAAEAAAASTVSKSSLVPDVEYEKLSPASQPVVWHFVRDMDHWAPLVTGYQRHKKISDTEPSGSPEG